VPYAGLVVVVISLMYVPWFIVEKRRRAAQK